MAIINVAVDSGFTQIPNETARDTSLSLQARAILLYIRSLPHDWKIRPDHIAKENNINRKTLEKYLKELREAGYIEYVRYRDEKTSRLTGGDYMVYPYPKNKLEASNSKGLSITPNFGGVENLRRGNSGVHTKKESTKKESKSVSNTREAQKFETAPANFADRVMAELLADNLPASKKRYASLKIREYQERFPESISVADCWAYVVQAVSHQHGLTGS